MYQYTLRYMHIIIYIEGNACIDIHNVYIYIYIYI